jgi:signal transduction histidine kinase
VDIYTILKRNWIAFALACVMVMALLFVSEGSYFRTVTTLNRLGEMSAARLSIQELTRSVVDAETGQRGYMATARPEYRDPYDKALKNIGQSLSFLNQYYAGDPAARDMLEKLRSVVTAKLSEMALTLKLFDEGKDKAAREILLTGIGNEQMESIRKLSVTLLEYESSNVAQGRADIYRTLWLTRLGVAFLSVVGLLALYLYLRQTFALWLQQQELQRVVQVERDRLEAQVIKRTGQLTELAHHLQTAREDERHRLARNLHDDLGALLTSAKLDAARMRSRLAGSPPQTLDLLAHMVENLNNAIALGRRIIEDLRPSTLANLGLESTLDILARDFAEQTGVAVHCTLEPVTLAPNTELVVFRLVQEALTNTTKYAKAGNVWISLKQAGDQALVEVRDDGAGFDADQDAGAAFGLLGMRYRVEAERGTLTVVSAPGKGTRIEASLPQKARSHAQVE